MRLQEEVWGARLHQPKLWGTVGKRLWWEVTKKSGWHRKGEGMDWTVTGVWQSVRRERVMREIRFEEDSEQSFLNMVNAWDSSCRERFSTRSSCVWDLK